MFSRMKFNGQFVKFIFILIPLLLIGYTFSNCKGKLQNDKTVNPDKSTIMETDSSGLIISTLPSVIFFQPNSYEFDSIVNSADSDGIYEVESDFNYYANNIIELYKDSSLIVQMTNKKYFMLNELQIDKSKLDYSYGILLVDKDKYKIETGVYTDIDILTLIKEFFNN